MEVSELQAAQPFDLCIQHAELMFLAVIVAMRFEENLYTDEHGILILAK